MGLVVGLYSVIGGVILGLLLGDCHTSSKYLIDPVLETIILEFKHAELLPISLAILAITSAFTG